VSSAIVKETVEKGKTWQLVIRLHTHCSFNVSESTIELVNIFYLQTLFDGKMKRHREMNQCHRKLLTVSWLPATMAGGKKDELKRIQLLEIKAKKVRHFSLGTMSDSN